MEMLEETGRERGGSSCPMISEKAVDNESSLTPAAISRNLFINDLASIRRRSDRVKLGEG